MTNDPPKRVFTTFEIARLCGVFHSTVARWIDNGKLKAYTTPGKHRRIVRADLVAFMHAHDMPIPPDLEPEARRILIIDDDPAITRILERSWDHNADGYTVLAVNNPVEGLIEIGRHQPDALILDLLMPVLSGYEVCRILKAGADTRHIHIIAITAATPNDAQHRFLADNVDVVIPKPFDPRKIVGAIDLLLGPP
jgi:excisionase family DNA binding protein